MPIMSTQWHLQFGDSILIKSVFKQINNLLFQIMNIKKISMLKCKMKSGTECVSYPKIVSNTTFAHSI